MITNVRFYTGVKSKLIFSESLKDFLRHPKYTAFSQYEFENIAFLKKQRRENLLLQCLQTAYHECESKDDFSMNYLYKKIFQKLHECSQVWVRCRLSKELRQKKKKEFQDNDYKRMASPECKYKDHFRWLYCRIRSVTTAQRLFVNASSKTPF